MFEIFKKIFSEKVPISNDDQCGIVRLEDFRTHFENNSKNEFSENKLLIENIKSHLKPNRKNIFILDDICEIVEILKDDLEKYLTKINRNNEFNLISLCGKSVGFDMISIVANHPEITVDALMTDIIFGGNEKINGKKIIVDGVDIVIVLKSLNPTLNYIMFTGNIFNENLENSYSFSKKFEKCVGGSILDHVLIKDAHIVFEDSVFERIIGSL